MLEFVLARANYWAIIGLMMIGLYIAFQANNLIKRLVGLTIFQTSIFLFYITLSKVAGGTAPILYGADLPKGHGDDAHDGAAAGQGADAAHGAGEAAYGALQETYSNPLPHVLILTAIVVGVATLSVGLAIVVRIREAYGSIESDEVREADQTVARAQREDDAPSGAGAG